MKKKCFLQGILLSVLVMMVTALILGAAFTLLLSKGVFPMSLLKVISLITTFVACFSGSFFAGKSVEGKKLPAALLALGIYLLVILVIRGIAFKTMGEGTVYLVVTSFFATVFGGVLGAGKK